MLSGKHAVNKETFKTLFEKHLGTFYIKKVVMALGLASVSDKATPNHQREPLPENTSLTLVWFHHFNFRIKNKAVEGEIKLINKIRDSEIQLTL